MVMLARSIRLDVIDSLRCLNQLGTEMQSFGRAKLALSESPRTADTHSACLLLHRNIARVPGVFTCSHFTESLPAIRATTSSPGGHFTKKLTEQCAHYDYTRRMLARFGSVADDWMRGI
jgi:hypothetical protein